MKFLFGFMGAIVGAIVGVASALLIVAEIEGGDALGEGFAIVVFGPIGLIVGVISGTVLALLVLRYLRRTDLGSTARRKKNILIAGLVIGLPALVVGMFWFAQQADNPPSDQQLLANFQRHQATFNQLVQMALLDKGLVRVGSDWTDPSNPQSIGITPTRIEQYRKLFTLADVDGGPGFDGGLSADADSMEFTYWGYGCAISSDTDKGYAYMTKPPAHLLQSLDHCQPDERNGVEAYRHIQGNWYLYYKYLPG